MKITSMGMLTNFALLFIMIVFPMFYHNDMRIRSQEFTEETILRYNEGLHAAVLDAAFAMKLNEMQSIEAKYDSLKNFRANKEFAVEAFYRTLFTDFGIKDDAPSQNVLRGYIPALAAIEYDGFSMYTDEKFINAEGQNEYRQLWKAKKPYAYADAAGNSLSFTLDDYVFAYDAATRAWYEGRRSEVSAQVNGRIALLRNEETFEQVRRSTIVRAIQSDLEYYINSHNEYARQLGITYTFTLPTIDQEEWNNTINDIGVMAFIQGLPVGDQLYNDYALGGGRLIKNPVIFGAVRNGVKIYYRSSCNYPDTLIEKFTSEKDAAAKGYFPRSCANP